MMKSKINRATVTSCDPDYVGSITLDPELMGRADLLANERVPIWEVLLDSPLPSEAAV